MKQIIKSIDRAKAVASVIMITISSFFTTLAVIDWSVLAYDGDILVNVLTIALCSMLIALAIALTVHTVRDAVSTYRMNKAMFMQDSVTR